MPPFYDIFRDLSYSRELVILLAAVPAAANLLLALYIRLRLSRNATSGLFFFLTVAITGCQLSDVLCRMSLTAETAQFWDGMMSTFWIMVAPLGLHFALYFARMKDWAESAAVHMFMYGPALIFDAAFKLTNSQHERVYTDTWGWLNLRSTPVEELLVMWMAVMVLITVVILFGNAYRSGSDKLRARHAWVIAIGYSIPAFQGIVTEAVFPIFLDLNPVPLTSSFMSFFSLGTLVALTRFKLFHIPDFVNRELLLDLMRDIVITVSRDYKITYVNEYGARALGMTKEVPSATEFPRLFANKNLYHAFLEEVETAYHAQRDIENYETTLISSSGQRYSVLISGKVIHYGSYKQSLLLAARDISGQKAAQKRLEQSEKRFRSLIEKGDDGLIMMNTIGNITYGSPSSLRMLGYPTESLLRLNFFEIVHTEDFRDTHGSFGDIVSRAGASADAVLRLKRLDGGYIWVEATLTNMLDEEGVESVVGYFRDITMRNQMEREREATLALFDSVIRNIRSGILILDPENRILSVNNDFCEIFGIDSGPEALIHKDNAVLDEGLSLLANPSLFKVGMTAKAMARKAVSQERINFRDGRIYEQDYIPIYTGHGEFIAHLWKYRDITEEVRALEQIHNQTAAIQQLYDASPYGIVVLDNEDRVVNANAAFEQIFGYALGEMRGVLLNNLIVPNYLHGEASYISESCLNKESVQVESKRRRKDGSLIDVMIVGYPIVIDNVLTGIYGIYTDITERKQAEVSIITKNLELEKINRELDRFVYSTSHDIRAPLMSVLGLINLAESETKDNELLKYFTMMRASISRLDSFIRDIIHYSRNARLDVNVDEIAFGDLAQEIVENLRYQDMTRRIRFRQDIDKAIPFYSDRMRVYTIMNNLVGNAIKYHNYDQDAPEIIIEARIEDEFATIRVQDNGLGIPADKQQKIFDMFYRGNERSTGSGLGLYIVQEMIEKLEGTIIVSSEEGKGSTFEVRLPNMKKPVQVKEMSE